MLEQIGRSCTAARRIFFSFTGHRTICNTSDKLLDAVFASAAGRSCNARGRDFYCWISHSTRLQLSQGTRGAPHFEPFSRAKIKSPAQQNTPRVTQRTTVLNPLLVITSHYLRAEHVIQRTTPFEPFPGAQTKPWHCKNTTP